MANKNKNTLYLGLAAIAAGILYAATRKTDKAAPQTQANTTTTTTTTKNTSKPLDNNIILKIGSKGAEVVQLQKYLGVSADGIFGPLTQTALKNAIGVIQASINQYLNSMQSMAAAKASQSQKNEVTFKYPVGKNFVAAVDFDAYYYTNKSGAWKNTDAYGNSLGFITFKKGSDVGQLVQVVDYTTPLIMVAIPSFRRGAKVAGEYLYIVKVKGSWLQ